MMVTVSYIESGSEFYVQSCAEAATRTLESIQDHINKGDRASITLEHPQRHQMVVVPFQGLRYRAVVRDIHPTLGHALLFFLDYGNSSLVSLVEVEPVPEGVAQHGPLSRRCRLAGVSRGRAEEVGRILADYCEDGRLPVEVTIARTEGGVAVVTEMVASGKGPLSGILKEAGASLRDTVVRRVADFEYRLERLERVLARRL